jgi:hypothetical protein
MLGSWYLTSSGGVNGMLPLLSRRAARRWQHRCPNLGQQDRGVVRPLLNVCGAFQKLPANRAAGRADWYSLVLQRSGWAAALRWALLN